MITHQFRGKPEDVIPLLLRRWDDLARRFPTPEHATPPCRERFVRTVRFLMLEVKLSAAFLIRAGRCRALLIFANSEYSTPWDWKAIATEDGGAVDEAVFDRLCADSGLRPRNVAFSAFWASHYILCSVEQACGCRSEPWEQYLPLLESAAEMRTLPDTDLILNRRDCPVLRGTGEHCYAFASPSCRRFTATGILPILSVYQGEAWRDLPLIEPDGPTRAKGTRWERKIEQAFFRGASTGPGVVPATNTRLAVAKMSKVGLVDAGITSHPNRFKIEDGVLYKPCTGPLTNAVPATDWSLWKYLIYADGHSAALRYASMMSCNSVILKVDPVLSRADSADTLWFFPRLTGARFTAGYLVGDVDNADHIKVTVAQLHGCVEFLRNNDDVARAIAARSYAFFERQLSATKRAEAFAAQICNAASASFNT